MACKQKMVLHTLTEILKLIWRYIKKFYINRKRKGFKLQPESPGGATGFPIVCLETVFPV